MDTAFAMGDSGLLTQILKIGQIAFLAFVAGTASRVLLDSDLHIRGLPTFCGLAGLYAGTWFWSLGGWDVGPVVAGYGILPLFAGALAVSGLFKLVQLGVAGPRW